MIAGAVAPSRAVGQMHAGSLGLSALLRLGDSISVVHFIPQLAEVGKSCAIVVRVFDGEAPYL